MASYQHGIYTYEQATSLTTPVQGTAGLQVIVGTAPVNMAADPYNCTNKPLIGYSYKECVQNVGFSNDFEKYTLCQSIYACFQVFNIAPIILINVLDPTKHTKAMDSQSVTVVNGQATVEVEGILLDKMVVKNGSTTLNAGTDYTAAFDDNGNVVITLIATATTLTVTGTVLDPTKVTAADIIGGYNASTNVETGLEVIRQVYPLLGLTPGLILAPGWSHISSVAIAMQAKCEDINGCFTCETIIDLDSSSAGATKYTDVKTTKETTGVTSKHALPVWPMCKVGEKKLYYSAIMAALTAYTDAEKEDVPCVSPSNKAANITALCLADGTEVLLDQSQANLVNSYGVTTAINMNGFKSWGGRTAAYPSNTDPKDMWFNVRRYFSWRRNGFILTFFQKVDQNADQRLIQNICDTANIEGNGYVARGYVAADRITYNPDENQITDILNGVLTFHHFLAPYTPAHVIKDIFEFSVSDLQNALNGGAK